MKRPVHHTTGRRASGRTPPSSRAAVGSPSPAAAQPVPVTAADVRDQHWLDQQVATLGNGIEAAKEIWLNWSEIRCVGRLHPGMTAGDFLASQLGGLRLDVGELVKALPEMSTREIAKVAGVTGQRIQQIRAQVTSDLAPDEPPARVVGADGKSYPGRVIREVPAQVIEPEEPAPTPLNVPPPFWPQLLAVHHAIRDLSAVSPDILAANVPAHRRQQFAKDLRRHGLILGAVAARLEDMQ